MPPLLRTVFRYLGFGRPDLLDQRMVVVGVVRDGAILRDEERIGALEACDRVEVLLLVKVDGREQLSTAALEVWAFDLTPTGETWPA